MSTAKAGQFAASRSAKKKMAKKADSLKKAETNEK